MQYYDPEIEVKRFGPLKEGPTEHPYGRSEETGVPTEVQPLQMEYLRRHRRVDPLSS